MKKLFLALMLSPLALSAAPTNYRDLLEWPSNNSQLATVAQVASLVMTGVTIDADFEKVSWIIQNASSQAWAGVGFHTNVLTTGGSLDIRLESVNVSSTTGDFSASGLPTGNLYCSNTSSTSYAFQVNNSNIWIGSNTFISSCAVAAGDIVAVVLTRPSGGTFNGIIGANVSGAASNFDYYASSISNGLAVGYGKVANEPNLAIKLADGSWMRGIGFTSYDTFVATNTTTTMKEVGNQFTLPFAATIRGVRLFYDSDSSPVTVKLYKDATLADSLSVSTGTRSGANASVLLYMFNSTGTRVEANIPFYVTVSTPIGGFTTVGLAEIIASTQSFAAGLYDQTYPGGENVKLVQVKTTVSTVNDFLMPTTTVGRLYLSLFIDSIDTTNSTTVIAGPQNTFYNSTIINSTIAGP